MAGPAWLAAAVPVRTKMPVPMMAPMPSSVRSSAVERALERLAAVLDVADQLLDRFRLEQIRIHSPSAKGGRIRDPSQHAGVCCDRELTEAAELSVTQARNAAIIP